MEGRVYTVTLNGHFAEPLAFHTVTVHFTAPAAEGVPEIVPVAFTIESPAGSDGETVKESMIAPLGRTTVATLAVMAVPEG
jgi:hypothetical protein